MVGFDDVPEAVRAVPALTTVQQSYVERDLLANRIPIARLRDEEPAPHPELFPMRLVVRGSTVRAKAKG